jgi:hypothetical protein
MQARRRDRIGHVDVAEDASERDTGLPDLGEGLAQYLTPAPFDPDPVLRDIGLEAVDISSLRLGEREQRRLALIPFVPRRQRLADSPQRRC